MKVKVKVKRRVKRKGKVKGMGEGSRDWPIDVPATRYCGSHVQVLHVEGVVLDELAAGRDFVAHEEREQSVGLGGVADIDA